MLLLQGDYQGVVPLHQLSSVVCRYRSSLLKFFLMEGLDLLHHVFQFQPKISKYSFDRLQQFDLLRIVLGVNPLSKIKTNRAEFFPVFGHQILSFVISEFPFDSSKRVLKFPSELCSKSELFSGNEIVRMLVKHFRECGSDLFEQPLPEPDKLLCHRVRGVVSSYFGILEFL